MAATDVTLTREAEFEADGTQKTATLLVEGGGILYLTAAGEALISWDGATINTTQATQQGVVRLKANIPVKLPPTVKSFTFKAAASTFIQYLRPE